MPSAREVLWLTHYTTAKILLEVCWEISTSHRITSFTDFLILEIVIITCLVRRLLKLGVIMTGKESQFPDGLSAGATPVDVFPLLKDYFMNNFLTLFI